MILDRPRKILVIVVTRIGDTLLATPAIRAVATAYPEAEITVLAHPKRAALLAHLPFIAHLGSITKQRALFQGRLTFLQSQRPYDAAMVFGHDAALQRYARRVSTFVVCQGRDATDVGVADSGVVQVAGPSHQEHAVEAGLRLAMGLYAPAAGRQLACVVTPSEVEAAQQLLQHAAAHAGFALSAADTLIGLQLRSSPTKAYRDWPLESFVALLQKLFAEFSQARVVVLGDAASVQPATELMTQFGGKVCSLAGQMNLRQMAGVMSQLQLYVGVDTGPTHLAGALSIPMVALYHCRHRGTRLAPLEHPALSVIEHPAADSECGRQSSMADISVDNVWQAVQQRLRTARYAV